MPKSYYVVNAGRGRSTHIMYSRTPSTPNPRSLEGVVAQLLWFGGNAKPTLCGLAATRHVNMFSPAEVSCRECRRRWERTQRPSGDSQNAPSGDSQNAAAVRRDLAEVSQGLEQAIASGSVAVITAYRERVEGIYAQWRQGRGPRLYPDITREFDRIIARAREAGTAVQAQIQREVAEFEREVAEFEREVSRRRATGQSGETITGALIQATMAALLRDGGRPDSEIARETGVPEATVATLRRELTQGETAGMIAREGLTAVDFEALASPVAAPAGKPPVITGDQAIAALQTYLAGSQPSVPGLTDAQAAELAQVMNESAHLPADEFRAALERQGVAIAG